MTGVWVGALVLFVVLTSILSVQYMQTVPAIRQRRYVAGIVGMIAAAAVLVYLMVR